MIPTRCLDMFPSALALAAATVLSTGCLDAPENYYGIDLTQVTFELESTEMGIHPSKAVLEATSNPFRENDVGAEMKWTVLSYGGSAAAFYAWATRLANEPSGEHQFYTAISLQRLYDNQEVAAVLLPYVRDMAIDAFSAVLEYFPDGISFDASGQFSFRLAPAAYDAIIALGAPAPAGWAKVTTADGGTTVIPVPDAATDIPDTPEEDEE